MCTGKVEQKVQRELSETVCINVGSEMKENDCFSGRQCMRTWI